MSNGPVTLALRFGNFSQAADYERRIMADTAAQHESMGDKAYPEQRRKIQRRNEIAYLLGMDAVEKGKVKLAQVWEGEGNLAEALKAYQTSLTTWNDADADLPQVKKAKAWMRANDRQLTADK